MADLRSAVEAKKAVSKPKQSSLEELVEVVQSRRTGPPCALLLGAGCSVTGGVPLADHFVEIIRQEYPQHYRRVGRRPSYARCMAELPDQNRRDMIGRYVASATVNRAHLGVAQLLKHGAVDRILTTNFDLLILRACALVAEFPAVYDCAITPSMEAVTFHPKAVFYLHGQWSGLKLHNVKRDLRKQAKAVAPVIREAQKNRLFIVVGYSGRADPLVRTIASSGDFACGLYWVAYRGDDPAPNVASQLLVHPSARLIRGYDADTFFETLAESLGCWPPMFVSNFREWGQQMLDVCREGDPEVKPHEREAIWSWSSFMPELMATELPEVKLQGPAPAPSFSGEGSR